MMTFPPMTYDRAATATQDAAIEGSFHFWRGVSGRRYLFTQVSDEVLAHFRDAVVLVAEPSADGRPVGRMAGIMGPGGVSSLPASLRRLLPRQGMLAFVHFLARSEAERLAALDDLLGTALMIRACAA